MSTVSNGIVTVPEKKGKNEHNHKFDIDFGPLSNAEIRERKVVHNNVVAEKTADKVIAGVQSVDPDSGRVVMIAPDVGLREFAFDDVIPPNGPASTQRSAYDKVARRLVMDFLNGFNSTAIVYGQTGNIYYFNSIT